jgi:replicative DNA helicase
MNMRAQHKTEADGSVTISMNLKTEGSMLEQEEQIAVALAEIGRLATSISVVVGNVKHTSRGEEKKTTKRPTGKLK